MRRKAFAQEGEDLACNLYIDNGYTILDRNYHARRFGEVDLIAQDADGLIVFCEVKTRHREPGLMGFEHPAFDAITPKKRRKITISALMFLARYNLVNVGVRFDVMVIEYTDAPKPVVTWVKDAF
jgi:putative endonuclease